MKIKAVIKGGVLYDTQRPLKSVESFIGHGSSHDHTDWAPTPKRRS